MKWIKDLIELDEGGLVMRLLALAIIIFLAFFTPLQHIGFILKVFVMIGVIYVSIYLVRLVGPGVA